MRCSFSQALIHSGLTIGMLLCFALIRSSSCSLSMSLHMKCVVSMAMCFCSGLAPMFFRQRFTWPSEMLSIGSSGPRQTVIPDMSVILCVCSSMRLDQNWPADVIRRSWNSSLVSTDRPEILVVVTLNGLGMTVERSPCLYRISDLSLAEPSSSGFHCSTQLVWVTLTTLRTGALGLFIPYFSRMVSWIWWNLERCLRSSSTFSATCMRTIDPALTLSGSSIVGNSITWWSAVVKRARDASSFPTVSKTSMSDMSLLAVVDVVSWLNNASKCN